VGILAVLEGLAAAQSSGPLVAAHRGGALLWPENSLLAFRNAIALGADFLELDVHLSKDGEVVVIHDPALDRTTTGVGAVRERTLADLRALRLKDKDGKITDEVIPTLEEVVGLAAPTAVRLLLEIKADARRERYPAIEDRVLAILDRRPMTSRTIVIAFDEETIRRVRQLRPDVMVGALYSPRTLKQKRATVEWPHETFRRLGARFVGLHQVLVTSRVVAQAREEGLAVGVWTVNELAVMQRFVELEVYMLVTDRPDLAKELLRP
jgi:glycerophosphoryl diester phosphodiesterase